MPLLIFPTVALVSALSGWFLKDLNDDANVIVIEQEKTKNYKTEIILIISAFVLYKLFIKK